MIKSFFSICVVTVFSLMFFAQSAYAGGKKHMVLQLKGADTLEVRNIDSDGDGVADIIGAECYDVPLFNPATGKQIGQASDCLSSLNIVNDDGGAPPLGFNIALTGTTFFHLPGGTFVTQGLTTVRPVLQPTTRDGIVFTHITGANGDGGVQYGTRRFRKASGKVRLSGQVDMAKLVTDGVIYFDCIFVVDFDK
jgi:hypothetical protein